MNLRTQAEIAKRLNINRSTVSRFIEKNKIEAAGMKGRLATYDCNSEPLAGFLQAKKTESLPEAEKLDFTPETAPLEPEKPVSLQEPAPFKKYSREDILRVSKPLNDILKGKTLPGVIPSSTLFGEALKMAKDNNDAGLFTKLAQIAAKEDADELVRRQMIKTEQAKEQIALEKAAAIKLQNDILRERYIELGKIKQVFGKIYAVHTSILQPLSLKLGAGLASVPEGAEKAKVIRELIDKEVYASLQSIKRLLAEYITEDG